MTTLNGGQEIPRGASISSENGRHTLTLQDDGNLVLSTEGHEVWASHTDGSGVDRLAIQEDGNVVLYAGSDPKWATNTDGSNGARLELRDDRNLVVYGLDGQALWSANTQEPAAAPETANAPAPAPEAPAAPAPQAAPAPAPQAAPAKKAERTYTVVEGDTLSALAEKYYGDPMQYMKIAKANNIENPDLILVGQHLVIPE